MTHNGLSNEAAEARLRLHGPNALPERPPTPLWRRFGRQFQSPLIYILLFALVADAAIWVSEGATGLPVESIAIAVILLLNAGLGVYQESKSEAALARLKEMAAPMVWVMREGRLVHLPSADLVPGDVARIEAGDRVPADGGLTEAEGVMVDESVLTGESAPVDKALNDEVFSGTLFVRGKGYVEISRTGEKSDGTAGGDDRRHRGGADAARTQAGKVRRTDCARRARAGGIDRRWRLAGGWALAHRSRGGQRLEAGRGRPRSLCDVRAAVERSVGGRVPEGL
jgi:hypothetical protein